jgi:hypothetical protein
VSLGDWLARRGTSLNFLVATGASLFYVLASESSAS